MSVEAQPILPADRSEPVPALDVMALRAQFPAYAGGHLPPHYLDNAATTQVPRPVIEAVAEHDGRGRANVARGVYALAEATTAAFEAARSSVGRFLGARPDDAVVFTGGATQGINLFAASFGTTLQAGDEIVVSLAEHHSNLVPWLRLAEVSGATVRPLPLTDEGRIDVNALPSVVSDRCRLIAVTHLSNVTGAVTDLRTIADVTRMAGALLLVDGAQAAPRGPLDLPDLGADIYVFSGHKVYGPTGVGVLWARSGVLDTLPPAATGGGMVRTVAFDGVTFAPPPTRFEPGTPPITQAVGLAAALDWLTTIDADAAVAHDAALTRRMLEGLGALPGVRILGPADGHMRAGVVSFDVAGVHPHDVSQILDEAGVAVRGGHHCAQPLMAAFGVIGCTRASLGLTNDASDVDALIAAVDTAIGKLR